MLNTLSYVKRKNNIVLIASKIITMETLKYKIIKSDAQYFKYCDSLESLVDSGKKTKAIQDEIEVVSSAICRSMQISMRISAGSTLIARAIR